MPWITPIAKTLLKTRPLQSSELSPEECRGRAIGEKLGIVSARKAENNHWEVLLAGELSIGGQKVRSIYLWPDHWQGVGEVYTKALDLSRQKTDKKAQLPRIQGTRVTAIPPQQMPAKTAQTPSKQGVLGVKYRSQLDNVNNPSGSCNVTSVAMCLAYWGVEGKRPGIQLEDELYEWLQGQELSRHDPIGLRTAIEAYGCKDDFNTRTSVAAIKGAIDAGYPVIIHGYFTTFGHIVVVVGYDDKGLIIHDPYGEWDAGGYIRNDGSNPERGKAIHYSYGLIERTCLPDGGCWAHIVTRPGREPQTPRIQGNNDGQWRKYKPQEFRLNSIAVAMIKSFEGLELSAYVCSAGLITIGLGTTVYPDGSPVEIGDRCTETDALKWFAHDSDRVIKAIRGLVDVPLTGLQIAALTSFVYNCGEGAFANSTLLKVINASGTCAEVQTQLRRWTNQGLAGLVSRRNAECCLWGGNVNWTS